MFRETLPRVFVGRERELQALRRVLAHVGGGRGRAVLVSGEAGIGKTRLLREVADEARAQGVVPFFGHCSEAERATPLAPIVEIVETALGRFEGGAELRRALGDDAAELARVVPRIRRLLPDLPPPFDLPPEQQRHVLFNALGDFLIAVARTRASLIVVEDLHWADEVTFSFAPHLCRRLADLPLAVVFTHRDESAGAAPGLAAAVEEALRLGAEAFRLQRLSRAGVGEVVRQTLELEPPLALVATLHRETDGNPFFLVEVLRSLEEDGKLFDAAGALQTDVEIGERDVPTSLRRVIERRLERLPETVREFLSTAAIAGREFEARLVAEVCGAEGGELVEHLEEATRAALIVPVAQGSEARYSFSHEIIRQTLVARLTLPRAQEVHLAIARAMEELHGTSEEHAIEIAQHYEQAGPLAEPEPKLRALVRAGERALAGQAFGEAVGYFERAAAIAPRDERERAALLERLGLALRSLGRWEEASRAWDEALATYERSGDEAEIAKLCALLTEQAFMESRWEEALAAAEKGLAALGQHGMAECCKLLALSAVIQGSFDYDAAARKIDEALALATAARERHVVLAAKGVLHVTHFELERACESLSSAAELGRGELRRGTLGNVFFHVSALSVLLALELRCGRFDRHEEGCTEVESLARRFGNELALWETAGLRAFGRVITRGDLAALPSLEELLGRSLEETRALRAKMPLLSTSHHASEGIVAFWRGDWARARARLREAAESEPPGPLAGAAILPAILHAYAGEREEALAIVERLRPEFPLSGRPNTARAWGFLLSAVEVLAVIGERERAAALYPLVVEAASGGEILRGSNRLIETLAGIAATAGRRWEVAEAHFRRALRRAADFPLPIEQAEIRRFHAAMMLERGAAGDAEEAVRLLGEAIVAYEKIGMPKHREIAAAMLATAEASVSGAPVRAPSVPPVPGVFRRDGDFWTVVLDGTTARVKQVKGLDYIARLLAEPGREFHVLDLFAGPRAATEEARSLAASDAGEILDAKARAAYASRLEDLRDTLEEAKQTNDLGRIAAAEAEIDALGAQIANAVGLGGRSRRAGSAAERARAAVTMSIRTALRRIAESHPALGRHLETTVRTGAFCVYVPSAEKPVSWRL